VWNLSQVYGPLLLLLALRIYFYMNKWSYLFITFIIFFNFLIRFRHSWPRNALLTTHRVRWFTSSIGTFKLLQNCPCPFIKDISIRSFLFVEESFQPLFYTFSSLFIPSPFPISLALNKSRKQGRSSLFLWVNFHFKFMHSRVLM